MLSEACWTVGAGLHLIMIANLCEMMSDIPAKTGHFGLILTVFPVKTFSNIGNYGLKLWFLCCV